VRNWFGKYLRTIGKTAKFLIDIGVANNLCEVPPVLRQRSVDLLKPSDAILTLSGTACNLAVYRLTFL
jgi:hypothetical protein